MEVDSTSKMGEFSRKCGALSPAVKKNSFSGPAGLIDTQKPNRNVAMWRHLPATLTQISSNIAQLMRGQNPRNKMNFDNFDVQEAAPVMASSEETTSAA